MTVEDIAQRLGGELKGDGTAEIRGVAGLREAGPADVTFLAGSRYAESVRTTRAGAILVRPDWQGSAPCPVIRVPEPDRAATRLAVELAPPPVEHAPGVHPSAVVASDVTLGDGVAVEACCVLEPGVQVGDGTVICAGCYLGHGVQVGRDGLLYPHVCIRERCRIGDRAIIHSGAVIGSDGFGYEPTADGQWRKIPQAGIVEIGDDVEIGANVTIDRARFAKTVIGDGVKLDNLIQVAHNVRIGDHTAMAAQVGISGSVTIGRGVQIGGKVGMVGHIDIGDNAVLGAGTNVVKDVPPGSHMLGYIAMPRAAYIRMHTHMLHLPELNKRVKALERKVDELGKDREEPARGGRREA